MEAGDSSRWTSLLFSTKLFIVRKKSFKIKFRYIQEKYVNIQVYIKISVAFGDSTKYFSKIFI